MISINELKTKFEELGYFTNEELLYDAFNALCMFSDVDINPGQDIYAICLEGPPGAGKTEFAKVYTKLANNIFNSNVLMVDYQCDATTGKTELFEDINISAAIRGDSEHVNIPGKLIEAINKVNQGNKVVLFIDEYDKAREETDAFLLQFLQSGKINSTQHGDLEIKEEFKSNLQVILCKNDMREELSGPLSRRIRIIRLDYMEPSMFYKVAYRNLIEQRQDKVNDGLLNLVSLMYQHAYDKKEYYNRLPSCSEMLIAILDADRLLKRANAPQVIIYKTIIKNMFKSEDDIKTFESGLEHVSSEKESKLSALIKSMKVVDEQQENFDFNEAIARTIFDKEGKKLVDKTQEMQELIDKYKKKFEDMEQKRKSVIEQEVQKILLENGKLVNSSVPSVSSNFEDESAYVKRGFNIFDISKNDWTDVAEFCIPDLSHHYLIDKLIEFSSQLGVVIYENGILIQEDGDMKLIVVTEKDKDNKTKYRIMSNYSVIPANYISHIEHFISFVYDVYQSQTKTIGQVTNNVLGLNASEIYCISSLVYSDDSLSFEMVKDNVYYIDLKDNISSLDALRNNISSLKCNDVNSAINSSNQIINSQKKVLINE